MQREGKPQSERIGSYCFMHFIIFLIPNSRKATVHQLNGQFSPQRARAPRSCNRNTIPTINTIQPMHLHEHELGPHVVHIILDDSIFFAIDYHLY